MAQLYKIFIATLFVFFNIGVTYGQHPTCYFCRTFIEGEACNDPVDLNAIPKQNCTDFSIIANDLALIDRTKLVSNSESTICVKITYIDGDGALSTTRGCEFQEYDNTDFCTYATLENANTASLNRTGYSCNACSTDLCNSSSPLYLSLVVMVLSMLISLYL